jgi:hypothetical protein
VLTKEVAFVRDFNALVAALEAADYDKTDPAVRAANRTAYDSLRAFHQSLVDLVPGLSLVFPVPGPLGP